MGIIHKNANFHGSENDFLQIKKLSAGKRNWGVKNKTGSTTFSSTPNTHETYEAWSHSATVRFSCLIVNTAAAVNSRGQALGLNAVILTCFCAIFVTRSHQFSLNSQLAYCATGKSSQRGSGCFEIFAKLKYKHYTLVCLHWNALKSWINMFKTQFIHLTQHQFCLF